MHPDDTTQAPGDRVSGEAAPMRLFAFVRRRADLSREDFLRYWHEHHGPLIRDTPELARHVRRYEQRPAHPNDRSGWDGVAVQDFDSWDEFLGMITGPAGEAMRADEQHFLDPESIKVVFTQGRVVVIDDGPGAVADDASGAVADGRPA